MTAEGITLKAKSIYLYATSFLQAVSLAGQGDLTLADDAEATGIAITSGAKTNITGQTGVNVTAPDPSEVHITGKIVDIKGEPIKLNSP
jgi:hypothetical protein